MKTLQTLIKIHKQKLDVLRRNLVSLEQQQAQLQALVAQLEEELRREIKLAESHAELAAYSGDFIKRIRERQERVRREIKSLEQQIAVARDAVRLEYGEQLKYEHMLEQRKQEKRAAAEQLEARELDEIAGQQHGRKEPLS